MPRLAPGIHVVDGGADPKYAGLRPKELRNSGAARSRQVRDEAAADRVGSERENDGDGARLPQLVAIDDCALSARHVVEDAALDKRVYARVAEQDQRCTIIIAARIARDLPSLREQLVDRQ